MIIGKSIWRNQMTIYNLTIDDLNKLATDIMHLTVATLILNNLISKEKGENFSNNHMALLFSKKSISDRFISWFKDDEKQIDKDTLISKIVKIY